MLMEYLKKYLPESVSTYMNQLKVSDIFKAAVLVDEYVLPHEAVFVDRPFSKGPVENLNGNRRNSARGMVVKSECGRSAGS